MKTSLRRWPTPRTRMPSTFASGTRSTFYRLSGRIIFFFASLTHLAFGILCNSGSVNIFYGSESADQLITNLAGSGSSLAIIVAIEQICCQISFLLFKGAQV